MQRLGIAVVMATATVPLSAQAPAGKTSVLGAKLEHRIAELDDRLDGVLAVAIKDLTDGKTILLHPDEVMPTASTIKIAVLAELYRQEAQRDPGQGARLADTYVVDSADFLPGGDLLATFSPGVTRLTNRDLASLMMGLSDNSATNALIRRVGMERVNATLESLGLKETRLRRRMLDLAAARAGRENTATPRELVALLEALWKGAGVAQGGGPFLNGALREDLFRVMAFPKDRYLTRLLPESARMANKPGWLEGVRVDAGIGLVPNRPFAIAVMITYAADDRAAEAVIAEIGLAAWNHFQGLAQGGSYGRRMP